MSAAQEDSDSESEEELEGSEWAEEDPPTLEEENEARRVRNGKSLRDVPIQFQSNFVCVEAIKRDPFEIRFVKRPKTKEMVLTAVKGNGLVLEHLKTYQRISQRKDPKFCEEFCMEAVKQNGMALKYVVNKTEPICTEALKQNYDAFKFFPEDLKKAVRGVVSLSNQKSNRDVMDDVSSFLVSRELKEIIRQKKSGGRKKRTKRLRYKSKKSKKSYR